VEFVLGAFMSGRRFWSGARGQGAGIAFLRAHVGHTGEDCLPWPMSTDGRGYGVLGFEGENYKAHRMMCILAHGEPPSPLHQAAHSCGNGHLGCVNPLHLSWKTPTQNMADSVAHGTARTDRGRKRVKLTVEQVQQILALKGVKSQQEVAEIFGVSWRQIGKIQRGVSWRGGQLHKPGFKPGDPRNPFTNGPRIKGRTVSAT